MPPKKRAPKKAAPAKKRKQSHIGGVDEKEFSQLQKNLNFVNGHINKLKEILKGASPMQKRTLNAAIQKRQQQLKHINGAIKKL